MGLLHRIRKSFQRRRNHDPEAKKRPRSVSSPVTGTVTDRGNGSRESGLDSSGRRQKQRLSVVEDDDGRGSVLVAGGKQDEDGGVKLAGYEERTGRGADAPGDGRGAEINAVDENRERVPQQPNTTRVEERDSVGAGDRNISPVSTVASGVRTSARIEGEKKEGKMGDVGSQMAVEEIAAWFEGGQKKMRTEDEVSAKMVGGGSQQRTCENGQKRESASGTASNPSTTTTVAAGAVAGRRQTKQDGSLSRIPCESPLTTFAFTPTNPDPVPDPSGTSTTTTTESPVPATATATATATTPTISSPGTFTSPLSYDTPVSHEGADGRLAAVVLGGEVDASGVQESPILRIDETPGGVRVNNYNITKTIGRGAYGVVSLATDDSGKQFAVKVISKSKMRSMVYSRSFASRVRIMRRPARATAPTSGDPSAASSGGKSGAPAPPDRVPPPKSVDYMYQVKKEIAILKKLRHPHCVELFEVIEDPKYDSLYMVFELCEKGVVIRVDPQGCVQPLTLEKVRKYFRQMILGLEYLHAHGIIHRDIKPDNLLLTQDDVLKFVDFGVSERFIKGKGDCCHSSAGAPAFKAPEMLQTDPVPKLSTAEAKEECEGTQQRGDIWSLGVCLYCLRYGRLPFRGGTFMQLYSAIRDEAPDVPVGECRDFKDLILRILDKNPETRITINDMRDHPWVTENGTAPLPSREDNLASCVEEVSESDIDGAIKRLNGLITVIRAVSKFKRSASANTSPTNSMNTLPASKRSGNLDQDPYLNQRDPTQDWFVTPSTSPVISRTLPGKVPASSPPGRS